MLRTQTMLVRFKPDFRATTLRVIYDRFLVGLVVVIQLLLRGMTCKPVDEGDDQSCDVDAHPALGLGDYSRAIGLQANLVRIHPEEALTLYHATSPTRAALQSFQQVQDRGGRPRRRS